MQTGAMATANAVTSGSETEIAVAPTQGSYGRQAVAVLVPTTRLRNSTSSLRERSALPCEGGDALPLPVTGSTEGLCHDV